MLVSTRSFSILRVKEGLLVLCAQRKREEEEREDPP